MGQGAGCGTSFVEEPLYYTYFIKFFPKVSAINPQIFKELYVSQSLSLSQIANQLNISKASVRNFIHKSGLSTKTSKQKLKNPKNYRLTNPPYGYRIGKQDELLVEVLQVL